MTARRNRVTERANRRSGHARFIDALESRILFSFGLTTTSSAYTLDTGTGLVFSIARTAGSGSVGDLTSMILNGTQLEAPFSATSRFSHYESGLSSATAVTATVDPNGNWIEIACNDTGSSGVGVIQYYVARKGFNNIYMATDAPGPNSPSPGEMRFITYTNHSVLTNAPAPSNNTGSGGAIESSDVFGHPDGTTTSKYYGEYRAIDTQTYGLTGGGFGLFMNIGNRETSSGGPFFKDIDFQTTSTQSTELYNYMFSGHSQTENFRPGLKGFYALEFTTSATTPPAPDYSWIDSLGLASHIAGYVAPSGRGTLTGTASGVPTGNQVTVGLSNAADQYWGTPDASGNYTITGVLPGTYTETLYQNELAVGTTTVTVAAGQATTQNITDAYYTPAAGNTIFRIGTWDGTPLGFLNSDKITDMHPTDVRMSPWAADSTGVTNFTVGTDPDSSFPMAEWHAQTSAAPFVDTDNRITFTVTSAQAATALTFRIGLTRLDSARPTINVDSGAFTSAVPAIASEPSARGLTTGNWRGNNVLYTYDIPAGTLKAGTNTIDIFCTSGSSGTLFSGYQIYDALDLVPTASAYTPPIASVTVTPSTPSAGANGADTFTAVARDASGNVIPANFAWSAARGSIDGNGNYVAPATGGPDTITVIATTTGTPGFKTVAKSSSSFTGIVSGSGNATIAITGFGLFPPSATVLPGGTLQLIAGAFDPSGNVTTSASDVTWSILSGPGTISTTGLFVASTTTGASTTIQVNSPGNPPATSTVTVASATALYTADISNGTTLTDSSGRNQNATLTAPFSYTPGVSGNALTLSGGFAQLPAGIVSSLSNFTISTWVNVSSLANWARIFDFGTGSSVYMFLTPDAGGTNALRFSITTAGGSGEQQLNGPALAPNTWTHIAVTLAGTLATLYVGGQPVATNSNMTLHPSSLGNTTLNYLGKSQFSTDPALNASIDDFRIYPLALSAQQIAELASPTIIAAASTPSTDISTNMASLSVAATDITAGEPALIYTWSAIGTPPAPVTFTDNGTNAGKNTTAAFTKAGQYTLQVSIMNPAAGIATTSTISLTVFAGDANQDGTIDLSDLSIILNNFGGTSPAWTSGNFTGGSSVDLTDLSYVLNNFGDTLVPPTPSVIPAETLDTAPPTIAPVTTPVTTASAPTPTPIATTPIAPNTTTATAATTVTTTTDAPTTALVSTQLPTPDDQTVAPTPATPDVPSSVTKPAATPKPLPKPTHAAPVKPAKVTKKPAPLPRKRPPIAGHYRFWS